MRSLFLTLLIVGYALFLSGATCDLGAPPTQACLSPDTVGYVVYTDSIFDRDSRLRYTPGDSLPLIIHRCEEITGQPVIP